MFGSKDDQLETDVVDGTETDVVDDTETKVDVVDESTKDGFKEIKFKIAYGTCYAVGDVDFLPENNANVLIGSGIAEAV